MTFDPTLLIPYAAKYIWWKTPAEAIAYPLRVVAQVMELGVGEDVQTLIDVVGEDTLRDVIHHAEIGWFSPCSWAYWHCHLGLAEPEHIPPMPQRKLG